VTASIHTASQSSWNEIGAGVDTMIFDVPRPSVAETLERMEWMATEVFTRV
jgi:hypothetical protein